MHSTKKSAMANINWNQNKKADGFNLAQLNLTYANCMRSIHVYTSAITMDYEKLFFLLIYSRKSVKELARFYSSGLQKAHLDK